MTTINSGQITGQAQLLAEGREERLISQSNQDKKHSAVLHRGTLFALGGATAHTATEKSLKAKRMIMRLARLRAMHSREIRSERDDRQTENTTEAHFHGNAEKLAHHERIARHEGGHGERRQSDRRRDEREHKGSRKPHNPGNRSPDGGRQGSGGGGQQQQGDGQRDKRRHTQTGVAVGAIGGKAARSVSRLEDVARQFGEPGQEGERHVAVRAAAIEGLLDIAERSRSEPTTPIVQLVVAQSIDLLSIQQRIGRLPPEGLSAFVERANARRAAQHTSRPAELALGLLRTSSILPLIPLLALNADRPSTAHERDGALATLQSIRAAGIGRPGAHSGKLAPSSTDEDA